ncbi:baseplate wedge protein [Aeromonas phage AerS_266]|nr:baseplate wedge protein [Aeromonas phage AerS_266]
MPININSGNEYFYTEEFKTTVRSCKEIILAQASWAGFESPAVKQAYKGNFHKLLRAFGGEAPIVPEDMIWVIAYINGIENPNADFSHLDGLWIVDRFVITNIIQVNRVIRE